MAKDVHAAVWAEGSTRLQRGLLVLLEGLLEEARTVHVGAARHERVQDRRGHRNGYYARDLVTTYAPLPTLGVPRLLEGGIDVTRFDTSQRRQTAVVAAIGQLFLPGISVRTRKRMAQDLFGAPVSAGAVSTAAAVLDADVQAYQPTGVTDAIVFLFLEGISQTVRELGVERTVMRCAFGIHADGTTDLLAFRLADGKATPGWPGFWVDLQSRRLKGKALQLVTVDGHPALLEALREVYPRRRIRRGIAHKLHTIVVQRQRTQREACMGEATLIFGPPPRTEAVRRFTAWRATWRHEAEAAVRYRAKDLFHWFHSFRFPQERWTTLRTTNILERAFREFRRWTRPMGVFTNAASAERIMYGVPWHLNTHWQDHPLRPREQNA